MPNMGNHVPGGVLYADLCDLGDRPLYDLVICGNLMSIVDLWGGGMVQTAWIFIFIGGRFYVTRFEIVGSAKKSGGMVRWDGIKIYIVLYTTKGGTHLPYESRAKISALPGWVGHKNGSLTDDQKYPP